MSWEPRTISENVIWNYRGKNNLPEPPNHESLLHIHSAILKRVFPSHANKETIEKCEGEIPTTEHYKNDFPAMEKMNKIVRNVKGNTQELQPRERAKRMGE